MPQNLLGCDRDQELLLPPSLREWLPEEHLAWFVLQAVDELDLPAFYADYRHDGHGRAAHEPAMMVALLVYAYATGVRTSRGIERRCHDDVAFRVITANQPPDHATVARLRVHYETAIGGLFGSVLELCARAGMVQVGVVAVDGTKIAAAATHHATRTYQQIAEEILAEAGRLDAAEDELFGDARGDELPEGLRTSGDRRKEPRPGRRGGRYDFTRRVFATDAGKALYLKRQGSVEPVFGQIKSNHGANRFLRRGRSAVKSEWRLLTLTHNLLKLHRHQLATSSSSRSTFGPPKSLGRMRCA